MRHLSGALFMLLRNRLNGGVVDGGMDCAGDTLFNDGKMCRLRVFTDSILQEGVCGGRAAVRYQERCVLAFFLLHEPQD
jgi:hypothetical protein